MNRPVAKILKATLVLTVVSSVALLWLGKRALAELGERSLRAAPDLALWAELMGDATELELNGQRLSLSTMTTELPPSEVLARFEALCAQASPQLTEDLRTVQKSSMAPSVAPFIGVLKQDVQGRGGIRACLAQRESGGLQTFTSNLDAFLQTRDLAVFGQFRYLIARRTESGGTHALLAYNQSSLKLDELLPARGDAGGGDLRGVPRPVASTRLLSAQAMGRPYGMVAYVVEGTPEQALSKYVERLESRGIQTLRVAPEPSAALQVRGAVHDGEPLLVHAFAHGQDALVSVVKLGGRLTTQMAGTR